MNRVLLVNLIAAVVFLAACGPRPTPAPTIPPPPPRPVATDTPVPANDEEAILQLLQAQGEGVVQQDIDRLMDIWDEDGVITDANHTPDDPNDDPVWTGHDAIRERYVNLVFPSAPAEAVATDIQLTIEGDTASAISTTHIGDEVQPGGDQWTFARKDGRWKIMSLTYNLEPQ
jgi:ketosteroid isomerase-like protein